MSHLPVESSLFDCPAELTEFLSNPPLVGDETFQDYYRLFAAIVAGSKPVDAIDWLYTKDVVDLSFQIRRERIILASVVKSFEVEVVRDLLKSTPSIGSAAEGSDALQAAVYRIFDVSDDAQRWASNAEAKQEIKARLAARGHLPSDILAQAYIRGASHIEAIDKRIASCEVRRVGIIREIDRRNKRFARDLEAASSIYVGEFNEAAE